jgi:methionyl-tRNA synthetase
MKGYDVFFMTGTDEHGEKIEKSTLARGLKAGEEKIFVDEIVPVFKDLWHRLGIQYDYFIRTTDDHHVKAVQAVLDKLYKDGKIYKKIYKGWFCTPCETFWSEAQSSDGLCPDCKRHLEKLDEENYFFKISEYQQWLIDHINSNPDFIKPDFRRNEVLGFLREPLQDLCISRSRSRMSWGIEVPFDKNFVTYVWFDALINYISGIGYPIDAARFKKYWPADFHIIGKDILRHHAVYWPIMLHALGLSAPRTIFAHGWWILKGEKMSKSKGNVVDPVALIDKYGIDTYRYFLLREVPFGLDGTFSEEALIARYNNDLANDVGNLLNRTLTMVEKYFDGTVPSCKGDMSAGIQALSQKAAALSGELDIAMLKLDFAGALTKIWVVINIANKLIEDAKPWALVKEKKTDELASLMYALLDALRIVAISITPFMPGTAKAMMTQLGISDDKKTLKPGNKISKSAPLFPRIEVEKAPGSTPKSA